MTKLSYRKFCSLAIITLLLLSGITVVGISNVRAEQTTENMSSYVVWGEIRDKFGAPVDTAIVVAINENTGNATWVYAENSTYRLDLADINGSVNIGDTIKLVCSNGICISNKTFVIEGNSSMRIDFVLDPEEPIPPNISDPFDPEELASPEIDNPFNPEHNPSSPEIMTPEYKPDFIIAELSFSDDRPIQGDIATLTATVSTTGMFVESFRVAFYLDQKDNEHYIASKTVTPSPLEITQDVSLLWNTDNVEGKHVIYAIVDPDNVIDESNETNNELSKEICILTTEFCVNSTITEISQLKNYVSSILTTTDAKKINDHLDKTIDELEDALEEYNDEKELKGVIKNLNHATDECWKAVEETNMLWDKNKLTTDNAKYIINTAGEIIGSTLEISYLALHNATAKDITKVENLIVEIRIRYVFEKLSDGCKKIDEKLANAFQHYQKAMEALAEGKDIQKEIEQGYDKLLKAKEDVSELVKKGKITESFGNWVIDRITTAILVFPPNLKMTPYDIVIQGPIAKGYKTEITITVRNVGVVFAENVKVEIYAYSQPVLIASFITPKIEAGGDYTKTVDWTPTADGTHDVEVVLDPENTVVEPTKEDNVVSSGVFILSTYATPRVADWIITDDTTVENQVIIKYNGQPWNETLIPMECNVIITSNATSNGYLKLVNSNLTIVSGTDGQYKIQVNASGRFDVLNGSLVTSSSSNLTYNFIVRGNLTLKNQSVVQYMYGDTSEPKSPGGIQIFHPGKAEIDSSIVRFSKTHNIYCDRGIINIANNSVVTQAGFYTDKNVGSGIYCVNGSTPVIEKCNVTDSKQCGIYSDISNVSLVNNTVRNNTNEGIRVTNSIGNITNNTIQNNGGHGILYGKSTGYITNNTILKNEVLSSEKKGGEKEKPRYSYLYPPVGEICIENFCNVYVLSNVILSSKNGIRVANFSQAYIQNNTIISGECGITAYSQAEITAVSNKIKETNDGIKVGVYSRGFFEKNNITASNYGVYIAFNSYGEIVNDNIICGKGGCVFYYSYGCVENNSIAGGEYGIISQTNSQSNVQNESRVRIANNDVSGGYSIALYVCGAIVEGNRVSNARQGITSCASSTLIMNNVVNSSDTGIHVISLPTTLPPTTLTTIVNNNISDCSLGISVDKSGGVKILNNNITNCTYGMNFTEAKGAITEYLFENSDPRLRSPIIGSNNTYALICSAADESYPTDWFPAEALHAYFTLKKRGYTDDNIIFMLYLSPNRTKVCHYADDVNWLYGLDGREGTEDDPVIDVVGGMVTKERLKIEMNALSERLTESDTLFIYLWDHGQENGSFCFDYTLEYNPEANISKEWLTPEEFNGLLNNFTCSTIYLFVAACFSGLFIDPVYNNNTQQRVCISTASDTESYGSLEGIRGTDDYFAGCYFSHNFWEYVDAGKTILEAYIHVSDYIPNPTGESQCFPYNQPLAAVQFPQIRPAVPSTIMSNLQIKGNDILNCGVGIYSFDSNLTISDNNTITFNTWGIYATDNSEINIINNTISDHAKTEIGLILNYTHTIYTFYTSYGWGIYLLNSTANVSDDNLITNNLYGLYSTNTSLYVARNIISKHSRTYLYMTVSTYNSTTGKWDHTPLYGHMGYGTYIDNYLNNAPPYPTTFTALSNIFLENQVNMFLREVLQSTIEDNTFSLLCEWVVPEGASSVGIVIHGCMNMDMICNTFYGQYNNTELYRGVEIHRSSNMRIINCTFFDLRYGVFIYYTTNTHIAYCSFQNNSVYCVRLFGPDTGRINITKCTMTHSGCGISGFLGRPNNISITFCEISHNTRGIWFLTGSSNIITNCAIHNNSEGIRFSSPCFDNFIYTNNFISNTIQAWDESSNCWDDGISKGNHWSDYSDVDADSNGIWDTPYPIPPNTDPGSGSRDRYPLVGPVPDVGRC